MKKSRPLPSREVLEERFRYDSDSGDLIWRTRTDDLHPRTLNMWNSRFAGKPAGVQNNDTGYRDLSFEGRTWKVHRFIWKLQTGQDPEYIDHIDGDRMNNVWSNLREVSWQENLRNKQKYQGYSTPVTGVTRRSGRKPWIARIGVDGSVLHLGSFEKKEDAIAARKSAETRFGFHKNHGRAA